MYIAALSNTILYMSNMNLDFVCERSERKSSQESQKSNSLEQF